MGKVAVFIQLLLCFASLGASSALPPATRSPPSFAGVFLLIDGGKYTYSFDGAAAACRTLNATVATLGQMERALRHGLETCKYGWTAEQTAVIPRLTANKKCGQSKVGVVTWSANPDMKFGVFCFSAPDSEEASNTTMLLSSSSSSSSTGTTPSSSSLTLSSSSTSTRLPTTSTIGAPVTATPTTSPTTPPTTSPLSPSALTGSTTVPTTSRPTTLPPPTTSTLPSPSTQPPPSTSTQPPPSNRVPERSTWKPADVFVVTSSVSTSSFPPTVSVAPGTTAASSASPAKPLLGGVSRTLLVLGIVLLLFAAAALVSYYKLTIFSFWPAGRLKDDVETEMWKHDDSETEPPSQPEEEDEEDRKYSGDITLCVNPSFRSDSSLV